MRDDSRATDRNDNCMTWKHCTNSAISEVARQVTDSVCLQHQRRAGRWPTISSRKSFAALPNDFAPRVAWHARSQTLSCRNHRAADSNNKSAYSMGFFLRSLFRNFADAREIEIVCVENRTNVVFALVRDLNSRLTGAPEPARGLDAELIGANSDLSVRSVFFQPHKG